MAASSAIPMLRQPDAVTDARHSPQGGVLRPEETPPIRLALLNGFGLSCNGVDVAVSGGAQHLLAFLAVNNRAIRRAQIAGTLWGDVPDGRAAGNLRSAIWRLRNLDLGGEVIRSTGDYLSVSASVAVDIRDVERLCRMVADPAADIGILNLEDFQLAGELLPGWSDEWVLLERERQRQISLHVLDALCERWAADRCYEKAVRAGLAAVAAEPLRESSNRALIRAFLAEGNPTEALRHFSMYRQVLRTQLSLEPSPQLVELVGSLADR